MHNNVNHSVIHPNLYYPSQEWSDNQTLHVAVAYTNPCRYQQRRKLLNDFRRHLSGFPNICLHVGEVAYGDRPFEVTNKNHPYDLQLRSRDELWHKENLLNLVISRFDPDWKYGCYIDGDFVFTRYDWALETVQQLQHYDWVQMFSTYTDLSYNHTPARTLPGFVYAIKNRLDFKGDPIKRYGKPGSPGGCWAFRRESFDACGGLLDTCILGSADIHMAVGLMQYPLTHQDVIKKDSVYAESIHIWQKRAKVVNLNVGFVDSHIIHHFHGPRSRRGYDWRWKILRDHRFNPYRDIYRDSQGLYQLHPGKQKLRDDIRAYFRSRNEDAIGETE